MDGWMLLAIIVIVGFAIFRTGLFFYRLHKNEEAAKRNEQKLREDLQRFKRQHNHDVADLRQKVVVPPIGTPPTMRSHQSDDLSNVLGMSVVADVLEDAVEALVEHADDFKPKGGSFGGGGASASWEPEKKRDEDDDRSRRSSHVDTSYTPPTYTYDDTPSRSYSSSDSGSSYSSCDSSSSSSSSGGGGCD